MNSTRRKDLPRSHEVGPEPSARPQARSRRSDGDTMSDARDRRVSPDVIRWSNPPFWARSIIGVVFAGVSLVMRAAARVYFSRLQVRHREHFPRHGPVLIVANHPAMWTDVIVLDVALGRKLHFLAQSQLFQPWLRGALLALHGALPVTPSHERPEAAALNAETFHTCEHLFARGEVVAMFPEGISLTDRRVLDLRPGAARIALNQALQEDATCLPVVIPVGLHYADRHAYGSVVTVSVGEPVDLAPFVRLARLDQDGAVRALTDTFHRALCSLTLDLPEPELAAAVTGLEPVAGLSGTHGAWELASAQRVAAQLARLRTANPRRFGALLRHCRAYRRAREALRLSDRALHWDPGAAPWRQRTSVLSALAFLGAPFAALGMAIHGPAWALGEWVAHKVDHEPVRFTFARISSGMVLYPVTWGLLGWALVSSGLLDWRHALLVVAATALVGLWTLSWGVMVARLLQRLRRLNIEAEHPRLVHRARVEQRALLIHLAVLRRLPDQPPPTPSAGLATAGAFPGGHA